MNANDKKGGDVVTLIPELPTSRANLRGALMGLRSKLTKHLPARDEPIEVSARKVVEKRPEVRTNLGHTDPELRVLLYAIENTLRGLR